jgi:anti-sigma factor RsiW
VRGWISAELDEELSDFEAILLRSHLQGCDACATFKAEVASFTAALRCASLEPLSRPIAVRPRRRLAVQPLRVPAVAALAVSAIALGSMFASLNFGAFRGGPSPRSGLTAFDDQSLRQLQLRRDGAVLAQLRLRQAAFNQIPRHPGPVNP